MIKVSIIIVNYNTSDITLSCVHSIKKNKPKFDYEIIVVDNCSDSFDKKAFEKEGCIVHVSEKNRGFSKANNIGMLLAKGEYFLLLNSDTLITNNVVDELVDFAQRHTDAGVVAPRLLNQDKSSQASIYHLPTIVRAIYHYWLNKPILDKYYIENGNFHEVESVVGAAFLITPKAQRFVGNLNEKYFMYFEDLDYCRKTLSQGLKVYYLPKSTVIHLHGASGNSKVSGYLVDSSKKYFGVVRYYVYTFILWSGQKISYLRKAI